MLDTIDQHFANRNNSKSDNSDNEETIHNTKFTELSPHPKESQRYNIFNNERFIDYRPFKLENDSFDDQDQMSNSDESDSSNFPSFGTKLRPKFVEFSNIFPSYPKTHTDGVAHIIELSAEILSDEKKVDKFRTALQYSLTKGHGVKTRYNVPFFSIDGEDIPVNYFYRQCNGT
jgi:hypothetical protein